MNELSQNELNEVKAALATGDLIEAIRLYRQFSAADLKTAKDAVEAMRYSQPKPLRRRQIRFGECCGMLLMLVILGFAGLWIWNDITHTLRDPYNREGAAREEARQNDERQAAARAAQRVQLVNMAADYGVDIAHRDVANQHLIPTQKELDQWALRLWPNSLEASDFFKDDPDKARELWRTAFCEAYRKAYTYEGKAAF